MQPCVSNETSIDLFQRLRTQRREYHLEKLAVLGSLSIAIARISERIELTGSLLFSEQRDFSSDNMKSIGTAPAGVCLCTYI